MSKEKIKIQYYKFHKNGRPPSKRSSDAGHDFYGIVEHPLLIAPSNSVEIPSGIGLVFPDTHAMVHFPKTSFGSELITSYMPVIDSCYRGEISIQVVNTSKNFLLILPPNTDGDFDFLRDKYCPGVDRRNLLIKDSAYPLIQGLFLEISKSYLEETYDMPDSDRGTGKKGSTDGGILRCI